MVKHLLPETEKAWEAYDAIGENVSIFHIIFRGKPVNIIMAVDNAKPPALWVGDEFGFFEDFNIPAFVRRSLIHGWVCGEDGTGNVPPLA